MRQVSRTILTLSLVTASVMAGAQGWAQDAPVSHGDRRPDSPQPSKPWSQAERYFDSGEMADARAKAQASHGGMTNLFLMADRFEARIHDGETVLLWDGQGWYGGDIHKVWFKTEGEYAFEDDAFEEFEVQALWSRAISTYFDFQAGLRYDLEPEDLFHGVIGIQGLAPHWWEVDAAAFVSDQGDVTARIEAENDLRLTQRLILQPRLEIELAAQDIPERDIGAGLSKLDAGLRLRYEIRREFAPYVGVEWERNFGETAGRIEAAGGNPDQTVFVVGLRVWF